MIGIFDSGLGGLSVLRHVRALLPDADLVYVADRARAPYGPRPLAEVRRFSEEISRHLIGAGASTVVLACNAASTAALHHLRERHPDTRFVGMEPAVKPAAETSRTGVIGVLTTAATFQGELLASVIDRFANGRRVEPAVCDGWVELVEAGHTEGADVESAVRRHVEPLLAAGADTLVLGCTHYPFLAEIITAVAGPDVLVIDPGPAVARQVARVASDNGDAVGAGTLRMQATGPLDGVDRLVRRLVGLDLSAEAVTFG